MTTQKNTFDMVIVGIEFDHNTPMGNPVYNVYGVDSYGDLMTFKTATNSGLGYSIKNYEKKSCRVYWSRRGKSWDKIIYDISILNDKKYRTIFFDWDN